MVIIPGEKEVGITKGRMMGGWIIGVKKDWIKEGATSIERIEEG